MKVEVRGWVVAAVLWTVGAFLVLMASVQSYRLGVLVGIVFPCFALFVWGLDRKSRDAVSGGETYLLLCLAFVFFSVASCVGAGDLYMRCAGVEAQATLLKPSVVWSHGIKTEDCRVRLPDGASEVVDSNKDSCWSHIGRRVDVVYDPMGRIAPKLGVKRDVGGAGPAVVGGASAAVAFGACLAGLGMALRDRKRSVAGTAAQERSKTGRSGRTADDIPFVVGARNWTVAVLLWVFGATLVVTASFFGWFFAIVASIVYMPFAVSVLKRHFHEPGTYFGFMLGCVVIAAFIVLLSASCVGGASWYKQVAGVQKKVRLEKPGTERGRDSVHHYCRVHITGREAFVIHGDYGRCLDRTGSKIDVVYDPTGWVSPSIGTKAAMGGGISCAVAGGALVTGVGGCVAGIVKGMRDKKRAHALMPGSV